MTDIQVFLILNLAFALKHLLADYIFQTPYMLPKSKLHDWVLPLALHSAVHAGFTFMITLISIIALDLPETHMWIPVFDFVIHFIIDRIKASPNLLNRFTMDNKYFWWSLGVDQTLHHITHIFIAYYIIQGTLW